MSVLSNVALMFSINLTSTSSPGSKTQAFHWCGFLRWPSTGPKNSATEDLAGENECFIENGGSTPCGPSLLATSGRAGAGGSRLARSSARKDLPTSRILTLGACAQAVRLCQLSLRIEPVVKVTPIYPTPVQADPIGAMLVCFLRA
jgi:hypothetical protein